MRNHDFAPLTRSMIGFDRMFDLLDDAFKLAQADDGYPPYDIVKTGENAYRIDLAVAGFTAEDLSVTAQEGLLVIAGRKGTEEQAAHLHRGIAKRSFERRFNLADHVEVTGASLVDGLLSIELVREIPEAMQPRRIEIGSPAPPEPRQEIEQQKAA
jgi:molecular chaperone IbpA